MSHNTIHVLPTFEQCRDAAKQKSREEWQRRSLNEDMLSEDIIVEIEEEWYSRNSSGTDSEQEDEPHIFAQLKSCLKKPPTPSPDACVQSAKKKKSSSSKKNQKKRKRSHSKSQGATATNSKLIVYQ